MMKSYCVIIRLIVMLLITLFLPSQEAEAMAKTTQEGIASYYADLFQGRKTASGKRYDRNLLTAAHRSLKFGTKVRVTNLDNGKSVVVTINDRGPFVKRRIIDLSKAAARDIGMIRKGTAKVKVEVLSRR